MTHEIAIEAPAKINLSLSIIGKNSEGYHLLNSFITFSELGDRIIITKSNSDNFIIQGSYSDNLNIEDNLVLKAKLLLQDYARRYNLPIFPCDIILQKELPIASGIGGGSSDAAATLVGLNRLWKLDISNDKLCDISLALGADVPMCVDYLLNKQNIWAQGIGEEIFKLPSLPACKILLVNNLQPVATDKVFKCYAKAVEAKKLHYQTNVLPPNSDDLSSLDKLINYLQKYKNDLQPPAIEVEPSILDVLKILQNSGALFVSMSGSGGTCLALYPVTVDEASITERITLNKPNWFLNWTKVDA